MSLGKLTFLYMLFLKNGVKTSAKKYRAMFNTPKQTCHVFGGFKQLIQDVRTESVSDIKVASTNNQ